jgi:hypothetical protein
MVGDHAVRCSVRDGGSPPSIGPTEGTPIDANDLPPPAASAPARRSSGYGRHIKEFGEGRVCGSPGCTTILSRYNCEGLCWGHEQSVRAARMAAGA